MKTPSALEAPSSYLWVQPGRLQKRHFFVLGRTDRCPVPGWQDGENPTTWGSAPAAALSTPRHPSRKHSAGFCKLHAMAALGVFSVTGGLRGASWWGHRAGSVSPPPATQPSPAGTSCFSLHQTPPPWGPGPPGSLHVGQAQPHVTAPAATFSPQKWGRRSLICCPSL